MRVYSPNFDYIYMIPSYQKRQTIKRYVGNSVLTIVLLPDDTAAHFLQRNSFIVDDEGAPYIVKHIEQGLEEITVMAYGGHKLLEQRVTWCGGGKNITNIPHKQRRRCCETLYRPMQRRSANSDRASPRRRNHKRPDQIKGFGRRSSAYTYGRRTRRTVHAE